jgi:CRISPR-associated protein Cas2
VKPSPPTLPPPDDWWYQAFASVPYEKSPPAQDQMLILIAYDIADPKRLAKIAKTCEDFGVRVQYSLFECQLDREDFETLWRRLLDLIHAEEDRLVAYRLDARNARETLTAGTMTCSEKVCCYLV